MSTVRLSSTLGGFPVNERWISAADVHLWWAKGEIDNDPDRPALVTVRDVTV